METAIVFSNGGSQVVRLPKDFRFDVDEILVNRVGNVVFLFPKEGRWQSLLASLDSFTDDFLSETVEALPVEDREALK